MAQPSAETQVVGSCFPQIVDFGFLRPSVKLAGRIRLPAVGGIRQRRDRRRIVDFGLLFCSIRIPQFHQTYTARGLAWLCFVG